jgi:hypothetical protein
MIRYSLLTAIGLTPGGSSTVYIYTQTIHRTTQWNRIHRTYITIKIHKHNYKIHYYYYCWTAWPWRRRHDDPLKRRKPRTPICVPSRPGIRYKPEGRGFDSQWCRWDFSFTLSFIPHYGQGVDSATNRNEYQEYFLWGKGDRCLGLTALTF